MAGLVLLPDLKPRSPLGRASGGAGPRYRMILAPTRGHRMRGRRNPRLTMLAFIAPEERVPSAHPLRTIKRLADEALADLSSTFDEMYAKDGRPSIPPERLLKASLLIALYSVRSERAFCEELEYNLLFRWFLDMDLIEPSFDPAVFTKNRERLLKHEVGQQLFDEVVGRAQG